MVTQTRPNMALPLTHPLTEEEKLANLRQAIAEADASPIVEGDIFEMIREEFGFPPYED